MPHILRLRQYLPHNIAAPVIRICELGLTFPNANAFPCKIDRRSFYLIFKKDSGNVIGAFSLDGQTEDAPHNGGGLLVNQPMVLVVRVFLIAVDGTVGGRLA